MNTIFAHWKTTPPWCERSWKKKKLDPMVSATPVTHFLYKCTTPREKFRPNDTWGCYNDSLCRDATMSANRSTSNPLSLCATRFEQQLATLPLAHWWGTVVQRSSYKNRRRGQESCLNDSGHGKFCCPIVIILIHHNNVAEIIIIYCLSLKQ